MHLTVLELKKGPKKGQKLDRWNRPVRPKGSLAESARHIGGDLEAPPDSRERALLAEAPWFYRVGSR